MIEKQYKVERNRDVDTERINIIKKKRKKIVIVEQKLKLNEIMKRKVLI